jgi:hypothetical protein
MPLNTNDGGLSYMQSGMYALQGHDHHLERAAVKIAALPHSFAPTSLLSDAEHHTPH